MAAAAKHAKLLLGCYRTGEANDPEVYVAAVTRVFVNYPADVLARVVDPVTGLASRIMWLPTVSEVVAACEEIHGLQRRIAEAAERDKRQVAAREREEADRAARPTLAELKAKHGDTFGIGTTPEPKRTDPGEDARKAAFSRTCIEREYAAHDEAPVYAVGTLVSRSLAAKVADWKAESSEHRDYRRRNPVE